MVKKNAHAGTAPTQATHESTGSLLSTVSGPATPFDVARSPSLDTPSQQRLGMQRRGAQALSQAMPHNALKDGEHGLAAGHAPQAGTPITPAHPVDTASTITEGIASAKLGDGQVHPGLNPSHGPLDRVRVDAGGQGLTTNQGVPVADNQNSLKAGLRGPTAMEDFILREKLTHFDHERIPERVVHARGSAAHGYFECSHDLTEFSRAAPFAEVGKRTPVFVRFSTVAGERGSADTVRDVRGFAVKFYTEEGNWDLVGNNIPVFFIQDAMKFPDLVHALKPEPHHGMPQAASAHDTFWDFVSLMPESAHMLLWVMSDRAIPRSYRMMQGFGVHTFRLVNATGESVFCKFHWTPVAGVHSLAWDEAVKINGADPDFHRRDLWEAIEAGAGPVYELGLQIFTEEQAESFGFDVLDATKLVPEERVPIRPVGRLVLDRNPDNFFAETEQVAFCTAHIIPGIDFSNDPLLQGRIHSYLDTQITRLGGPNFHEIPINAPISQVHNNQRDGMHRQAIHRGRVAYEPNSLGGGCPFQTGRAGFVSFPAQVSEDKVRGKPERFADHYSQAQLFWRSQSPMEQQHIIDAFRFELTKVQTPAIRQRVVSVLANIAPTLAQNVADGLGMAVPPAQPRALGQGTDAPQGDTSPALSRDAYPGDGSIRARRVAVLVAHGVDGDTVRAVHAALLKADAAPRFVGTRLGEVQPATGPAIDVEVSVEVAPSVLWDAVVIPCGDAGHAILASNCQMVDFVKDQYRHGKPMLVLGAATTLLAMADIAVQGPEDQPDAGIVVTPPLGEGHGLEDALLRFMQAMAGPRQFERSVQPAPARDDLPR